MKASQMLSKTLESASTYQGGPLSPETCLQESPLPVQVSRPRNWSGRRYHPGTYVLRRYDLPHERLKFKDTVVFLKVSFMLSGGSTGASRQCLGAPDLLEQGNNGLGKFYM